jgi:hypothetical protein
MLNAGNRLLNGLVDAVVAEPVGCMVVEPAGTGNGLFPASGVVVAGGVAGAVVVGVLSAGTVVVVAGAVGTFAVLPGMRFGMVVLPGLLTASITVCATVDGVGAD